MRASKHSPLLAVAVIVALLAGLPVASVGLNIFVGGTSATWSHLAQTVLPEYILNSLWLSLGVGIGVATLGVTTAWLTAMHDFPGRRFFEWALVLPLAMPAYVMAYVYTDFLQFVGPLQTALRETFGWQHGFTQMGWFFTKAALLTFGGAYAVLPYVYQGAVEHFGWLSATQMIDGLALGETTPGPLIMVVAFVGFVGGYGKELLGPDMLFVAGAAAATLVTWFTFLPSFLFILAGGPLVESTHDDLKFTAPLTAITAAVVGVILNLALFFGYHVLWPKGLGDDAFAANGLSGVFAGFEWPAAIIAAGAAIALFRFQRNVMQVIAACALAGLAWTQLQAG